MSRGFLRAAVVFIVTLFLPSPGFPGTFVGFGPQDYTRGTGDPVVVTNAFAVLNPSTTYTLQIYNGGLVDGEFEKVSSSVIAVNGVQIVGPNEFNQTVTFVEKPVTLAASNQLSVELRGKPGGGITIQIIGVDNDTPSITASVNPAPNAAGWHRTDVTVAFTCSDATSGIATCPNPVTVTQEGANQVISGTAVDRAGNTATASITLNIDKTPPTLSPTITPQPNSAGWNNSDVTVSFICSDSTSGVSTCPGPTIVTTEGANQLISGTATDVAGNSASASVVISLDKTGPTVTISSPANGSSFTSSPVHVTGTATDGLSGIATVLCNGSPAALSASSFSCDVPLADGPNTITAEATDSAGNASTSSISVNLSPAQAVTVTPEQADVTVSQTQQFTATVSVTTDQRVTWSVIPGGNANFGPGSINDTGLYTAHNNAPEPPFVTIKAISVADPSASGTAQVIVRDIADFTQANADNDLYGINEGDSLAFTWVDLPEGTAKIVFFRAPGNTGPWIEIKISENPSTLTSVKSVVYTNADLIPPDTANDYFYKLEAFAATGQLLKSYAPVFIPKFVGP